MSKQSFLRKPFDKQHGERSQKLLKSAWQHLYNFSWSLLTKLSLKKSVLVICRILGLFVNTLTADDKYSVLNGDILAKPIEMQLPKKQKRFCEFLSAFLKSRLNFKQFEKDDDRHSLSIFDIADCKRRCYTNV